MYSVAINILHILFYTTSTFHLTTSHSKNTFSICQFRLSTIEGLRLQYNRRFATCPTGKCRDDCPTTNNATINRMGMQCFVETEGAGQRLALGGGQQCKVTFIYMCTSISQYINIMARGKNAKEFYLLLYLIALRTLTLSPINIDTGLILQSQVTTLCKYLTTEYTIKLNIDKLNQEKKQCCQKHKRTYQVALVK